MSIKNKYQIKPIQYKDCIEWCLKKHYAKRIPPIEYAFGLFNSELVGIVTFGTPASNPLRTLWDKYKLMELNRLVVNEGLCKNALSFFVSNALKSIVKPTVIVSYADTSQGHHGYIYQATNWIYTGLSANRTDWKIKGLEHLHGASIADISRGQANRVEFMREKFGENFYLEQRPRKHRYFYFLGDKKQRKDMISKLPYSIQPYPKGDNTRYDASYKPTIQTQLF